MPIECNSELGITLGLIEGMMSMVRVLEQRDLKYDEVQEALIDLRENTIILRLLGRS